jgi:hypothetical protein
VLCMAFADVSDKNKAFVGSISIVHVVLSVGLLICKGRGIVLRFAQICKIMFQVWRCHCARVHFSAVLVARSVKIYVRIIRWTAF